MNFFISAANTNSLTIGSTLIAILMVLTFAFVLVAVCLSAKYAGVAKSDSVKVGKLKPIYILGIIGVLGIIIRILFVFLINGYGYDYSEAYGVANSLRTNNGFLKYTTTYLGTGPLIGYIYAAFGSLGLAFNLSKDALFMQLLLKLPYVLADIAACAFLYFAVSKYSNKYMALTISGLYFLSPLFFTMSSIWGSPISIYALILLLIGYFFLSKNVFGLVCATAAGLICDATFIFIGIIVAAYLIYLLVIAIIEIIKNKPSLDAIAKDNTYGNVYFAPICLLLGFMMIYLLSLPAFFADGVIGIGDVYSQLFIKPLDFNSSSGSLTQFSRNVLGIFTLFLQNNMEIGEKFPKLLYSGIILALSLALMLITFLNKKNRANLLLIASFVWATVAVYFVGAVEWSLAPSLIVLLLAFAVIKDKRILHVFLMLSSLVLLNALFVMLGGEQFGMTLVPDKFLMNEDGLFSIFSIVLSVLTVLAHVFFAVVTLDISLTKHRVTFSTDVDSGIGECIKNWYRG
ncbi:MAG: hypothetical protein J6Y68_04440 [Clostridia bacterium]|nr:hypothetical protein [Clostridia bacterium]